MMPALLTRTSAPPSSAWTRSAAAMRDRGRYVGLDGDRAVAELAGQGLDAVRPPREQGQAEAAGGQRPGGGPPMPEEAPVMTATRPVL